MSYESEVLSHVEREADGYQKNDFSSVPDEKARAAMEQIDSLVEQINDVCQKNGWSYNFYSAMSHSKSEDGMEGRLMTMANGRNDPEQILIPEVYVAMRGVRQILSNASIQELAAKCGPALAALETIGGKDAILRSMS